MPKTISIVFMAATLIIILMIGHIAMDAFWNFKDVVDAHQAAGSI